MAAFFTPASEPEGMTATWVRAEDDWSGITDPRERRRIQKRRNQRLRRTKRRKEVETQSPAPSESQQLVQALVLSGNFSASKEQSHADSVIIAITEAIRRVNILDPNSEHTRVILRQFEALAYQSYTARKPQITLLPSLYQFNFIRALFANVDVLGLSPDQMSDDAISPFNSINPEQTVSLMAQFARLPIPLRPTPLQCTTEHHPWIDLLPHPELRDNLFRRGFDSFDEDEFCHNLRGVIPGYEPGVLVWRAP